MSIEICVAALVGLPGLGKTTLSRWLLSLSEDKRNFNVIHLNYDKLLEGPNSDVDYKSQRSKILAILQQILERLKTQRASLTIAGLWRDIETSICTQGEASMRYLIICDDNNYYRSMRYKLQQFCRQNSIAYAQIYLEGSAELALERNKQRLGRERVPTDIIQKMAERLEIPNPREVPWEYLTLKVQASSLSLNESNGIVAFVEDAIKQPLMPRPEPEEKQTQEPSLMHHLDLLLRKRLKELLDADEDKKDGPANTKAAKQIRARNLNEKRKQLLGHARQLLSEGGHRNGEVDLQEFVQQLS